MSDLSPGQIIALANGKHAVVRFVGSTQFAPGEWVGVELEDASGKNDGSVQGERYFDCEMGYGMFLRPAAIAEIIEQARPPKPKVNGAAANGTATKPRPSSGMTGAGAAAAKRQSAGPPAMKRQSMATASPTPVRPAAGRPSLRSPTKSPTKQIPSTATSGHSTPRTSTPSSQQARTATPSAKPRTATGSRTSMGPPAAPASKLSRQSLVGPPSKGSRLSSVGSSSTSASTSDRLSARPTKALTSRKGSAEVDSVRSGESDEQPTSPEGFDDAMAKAGLTSAITKDGEPSSTISSPKSLSPKPPSAKTLSPPAAVPTTQSQRSLAHTPGGNRELEDLKAKLRVLEKKRMEDRDKLKGLERLQAERDKFEGIIQKLQTKYQPQQHEIADLRKQLKEAEEKAERIERQDAEHETEVEMATLDREMAEESAEALRTELQALQLKHEELELEVEVLREENQELGSTITPEERSSQGWLQMEKEKERLREALIRLRDITLQTEADLRGQVKELEEDLQEYGDVRASYEATKEQLLQAEANVEDLREQLDTALGAEEMIEELTERNNQYQAQVENLKAAIEDLESLKELNDELEINHIENEKQLQDEIDFKESLVNEQARKSAQQDEVIEELEYTLSKFRELVTNMQTDLEDMRASQQISETEANELTAKSRAMMDLNLKLQNSAAKAQVKTVEVELSKMKAEESETHLSIVQQFLPGTYAAEKDPVLAFLRFKRVGFKAGLMQSLVRERATEHALGTNDNLCASYEVLEKLTCISCLCDRFINFVADCSTEEFARFEGALYELEPVERGLNAWIDGLKKNELDENRCATELQRSLALLTHLAEKLITPTLESHIDEMYGSATILQGYLESVAVALSTLAKSVQSKVGVQDESDGEIAHFSQKIEPLISQSRSAKVIAGKVGRALQDLRSRSLALSGDDVEPFQQAEELGKELSEFARRLGEDVLAALNEEGRTEEHRLPEIHEILSTTTVSFLQSATVQPNTEDALSVVTARLRALFLKLEELSSLSSDLSRAQEFDRQTAPWLLRAQELRSAKIISPDAEEEIRRLKTDLQEQSSALGVRDKALEEQNIKIELLESRMKDSGKKATMVKELESRLEQAKAKERELTQALETHVKEQQNVEKERNDYRTQLEKMKRSSTTSIGAKGVLLPQNEAVSLASAREVEALRHEISSLQAAVRFLREENHRATMPDPLRATDAWLKVPLIKPKPSVEEQRFHRTADEAQDVLSHLLHLTQEAKVLDLSAAVPKEASKRLAWRPAKTTPRYQAMRLREEFESWVEWKDDFLSREKELSHHHHNRPHRQGKSIPLAAVGSLAKAMKQSDTERTVQIVGSPPR